MWLLLIALCDHAFISLKVMRKWCGCCSDHGKDISLPGMTRRPLFQYTKFDPNGLQQIITLSHSLPPHALSNKSLDIGPTPRRRVTGLILNAQLECTRPALWPRTQTHDVTDHLNARITSFVDGAHDPPCAVDYMRIFMEGARNTTSNMDFCDAPVSRCWPRTQRGQLTNTCVVLRVTTMDLEEHVFRAEEIIRL